MRMKKKGKKRKKKVMHTNTKYKLINMHNVQKYKKQNKTDVFTRCIPKV